MRLLSRFDDSPAPVFPQRDMKAVSLLLTFMVAVCFIMRLHLVFVFEVNWDEFLNLSMIYSYSRGEIEEVFQTGFVHAFGWISLISENEAEQIIAARLVMYILGLLTAGMIYLISRHLLGHVPALFALLSYLAFTFVIRNGNSFRTDTIAIFLIMAALFMVVCRGNGWRNAALAGAFLGFAGVATIKSIFYVPVFFIIFISGACRGAYRIYHARYMAIVVISAMVTFAVFIAWHAHSLESLASPLSFLDRTIGKTMGERDFSHAGHVFKQALLENFIFWGMLCAGLMAALISCINGGMRQNDILIIAMALPLLSLFIYTESYPYYYPFIIASAAVVCGRAFLWFHGKSKSLLIVLIGCLSFSMFVSYEQARRQSNSIQLEVIDIVHKIFPVSVAYIDRCSMISSFPKVGVFMSRWGMSDYYEREAPVIKQAIEQGRPVFILANRASLNIDAIDVAHQGPISFGLLRDDFMALKGNYVHHWGPIYVAGKKLSVTALAPIQKFRVHISGSYTLESSAPVLIDGVRSDAGAVVYLVDGEHEIAFDGTPTHVTLRWGERLYRPAKDIGYIELFRGF